jgi:hypothetical protein
LSLVQQSRRRATALAAALLVALAPAGPVRAHGDDPRIDVEAQRLSPGAPLTVRGYDFAYETGVELTLVGERERTHLASVTADVEGAFIHTVALPVGVAAGAYVVEAESGEHVVSGPPMLISGTPITSDDQDTRLEEGDSLLAPMPAPAAATGAAPVEQLPSAPADDGSGPSTIAIIVIGALVVVACAAWTLERRRRSQRPEHSVV